MLWLNRRNRMFGQMWLHGYMGVADFRFGGMCSKG